MVIVVEIEEGRKMIKPYLGGWRHKITGTEYLNANSQTGPREKRVPWESQCTRPIQTVNTKNRFTETPVNRATQMWRNDIYIANVSDKFISPKPYETHEDLKSKLNIEGSVKTIQRYYRAYRIAKFIKESANNYRNLINQDKLNEEEKILTYKRRHQYDILRKTYPCSKSDFDMLYNLMDQWKNFQIDRANDKFFNCAKRAANLQYLDNSVKILRDIDNQRVKLKEDFFQRKRIKFLTLNSAPIKWSGYKARITQMVTVKVQRARELKRLYDDLSRNCSTVEERIELLVILKNSLRNHRCQPVDELIYLIDQEIAILGRGIRSSSLKHLRLRLKNAFLYFVEKIEESNCFRKCKDNLLSCDPDSEGLRVPLETNMLFCKRCFRLLPYKRFSAHVRLKKIRFCSGCERLIVTKQARINYSLFTSLLNDIREDEMKRNCFSSLIFVIREPGIYHLINNIWHGRSIVSEVDDLFKLRLGRFDVNVEWSPWNCILLTEEEAEAHYYIKDFRTVYAQSLMDKIFLAQEQAKSHFRELAEFEKRFRESSQFYMIQKRADYDAPKTVENYNPNLASDSDMITV